MVATNIRRVSIAAHPHNGEGRPDLQFPDPITGEMIGGQVAALRMSMRYPSTVLPWARRQGKSKFRQMLYGNEASITPGEYYCGCAYPDHTTAAKIAHNFAKSWGSTGRRGGMVKDSKINDKDQDRWVELYPLTPPPGEPPPAWFTPPMKERWIRCQKGDRNTYIRIYFWGASYPHYEKIQGFPHHFNRVDWDEAQQIHPGAYGIVRPMRRDVRGHETFSGTPWATGIGNVKFESFWDLAGEADMPGWFRMRIPDGSNPHVPPVTKEEMRTMTEQEIRQTMYAEFLTGEGAVFSNLDRVFVLKPLPKESESLNWIRTLRNRYAMPTMDWWVHAPKATPGHIYAMSIDWARSPTGDYSVLTVWNMTTGKQAALFRWRGENFPAQMEVVHAIQKWYGATQLHADNNGMGITMSDFMRLRGSLGFIGHKFGRNKPDYVRRGQILFMEADIQMIDCPEQRKEFKAFAAFEKEGLGSEKKIHYCAPSGEYDDMVDAFLHLAPTLTIVGLQSAIEAPPEELKVIDERGNATLDFFTENTDLVTPWDRQGSIETVAASMAPFDSPEWENVVLTGAYT